MSVGIITSWMIGNPLGGYHAEVEMYHNCAHIHKICVCVCVRRLYLFCSDFRAEVQNRLHQDKDYPCEVVGSWNTWYGEQDQAGKQH